MASGPEHFKDAERNMQYAKDAKTGSDSERFHLDMALIHATLAHAAATALSGAAPDDGHLTHDAEAWWDAAGVRPPGWMGATTAAGEDQSSGR